MSNSLNSTVAKCGVCGTRLITRISGPLPGCPQGVSIVECPSNKTHMVNEAPQSVDTSAEQAERQNRYQRLASLTRYMAAVLNLRISGLPFEQHEVVHAFDAGFEAGTRWQRERLVTDAEVEAALRAFYNAQYRGSFNDGKVRAALEAARKAQP